jgi:Putative zinc-finger
VVAVTCEDIRELFSPRVDDALTDEERDRLDAHLATCAECAREWRRFERAVGLLRAVEPAQAPTGFVDRVLAARPQPWYRRLVRGVLMPWPVKVPLGAAAVVLVGGLAVMLFQRSPDLQRAARAPEPPAAVTAPSPDAMIPSPAPATPSPATRAPAPKPGVGPRREPTLTDEARRRAVEPPAESAGAGARAKSVESDREEAAPPAAPPPGRSERVQTLSARPVDVHARLTVAERSGAEGAVRELVARAGGRIVSRADEGVATVLGLTVPGARWDELERGLRGLGPLRLDARTEAGTETLRITLRLEP